MDRDERPADALQDVRDLQRDMREVQGAVSKRPPLTRASQGWEMPDRQAPPAPSSGGHLYADGGAPKWKSSTGQVYDLRPTPPNQGPAVSNVPSMTAGPAPADYIQTHSELMRDDIRALRAWCVELVNALRSGDVILG